METSVWIWFDNAWKLVVAFCFGVIAGILIGTKCQDSLLREEFHLVPKATNTLVIDRAVTEQIIDRPVTEQTKVIREQIKLPK